MDVKAHLPVQLRQPLQTGWHSKMISASKWRHLNGVRLSIKGIPLNQENRPKCTRSVSVLQHNLYRLFALEQS